jgi:hypothetical protein
MACDEYEIAIEMRLRGELGAPGAADLDRHLEGCAACRSYEALAKRTETTMTAAALNGLDRIDWQALEGRIRRLGREYQLAIWRSMLGLVVVLPLIVLFTMPPDVRPMGWVFGAVLGVLIVGSTTLKRRRWIREAATAARAKEDLLVFWRKDLDRRIRVSRLAALEIVAGPLFLLPVWPLRQALPPAFLLTVAVAAFFVGQGLWWLLWKGPRLRRERAELG